MLQKITFVAALLYSISLHTSMAAMELFSSILILTALVGVATKRVSFRTEFQVPILIFLIAVFINVLATPALVPWQDRFAEIRWVFLYWGLAKSLELIWSSRFERKLLEVWLFSLSIAMLNGIYQFFSGYDFIRGHGDNLAQDGDVFRATGFFSICLTYAYSIGLSGLSLILPVRKLNRWLPLIVIGITAIVILVSMARGAWVAFGASSLLFLFLMRKELSQRQLLSILGVLILPVLALISTEGGRGRLLRLLSFQLDRSSSIRLDVWQGYLQMFKENPILGVGFDQGQLFLAESYRKLGIIQDFISHAHNDYIQMLAETGLIGFAAYMLMIFWTLKRTYDLHRTQFGWGISLFVGQIFVLLGAMTQANFTDAEVNHFLMFSWALTSVLLQQRPQDTK